MFPRSITFLIAVALAVTVTEEVGATTFDELRPLLEQYCLDCHGGDKPKADVNLEQFEEEPALWRDPKLWERVLVQLRDKVMPPPKKAQPPEEERVKLVTWIHDTLERPDESKIPRDPGPKLIHRLSRLEYNNTVRDLLDVDTRPADSFPPDAGGGSGFDNTAGTLFIPPILFEKLMEAAGEVLAAADLNRLIGATPEDPRDERGAARASLARFASRAFRRPASDSEVARLLTFFENARERGESFEDALKLGCRAVLVSPQFIFRIEEEQSGAQPYAISDYELASRLSYFLWSSMPDEELVRLAAEKKLSERETLDGQVRRMIADPKARVFAENFAGQWLRTNELRDVEPSKQRYPQFTPALREALASEPVEFFHGLIRENRPFTDCLEADYTYVNETLARHYGLAEVQGEAMQRVSLGDKNRGGVLGMGGVLTLTSYPRRTSPVLRGKWVLEQLLGTPPPPPPPLVNTQKVERRRGGRTFRQRLEEHREDPKCAGCHARMDPLGFGLENFDAIGAWRTEVDGAAVDASGRLVTGEDFTGPAELKRLLLERKDEFLRNLTEKMLGYALGRAIEPCDWLTVRKIARAVAQDGYRAQTLILEIARSFPFRYRRPSEQNLQAAVSKPVH